MRHLNQGRKLNRTSAHRKALMRNLVLSLIRHERLRTTDAAAVRAEIECFDAARARSLRASFNIAVAELDPSQLWNHATIGVAGVSHSRDYLDGLMKNVERAAIRIANNAGAEVTDSFVEFF